VLYLSYDGMCDPLGGSQVLPYLFGLAGLGHRITLISFEKPERSPEQKEGVSAACRDAGIEWHPLPYHRSPPVLSTMGDVGRMAGRAEGLNARERFDLVHCRSYIPALVGLRLKRRRKVPFLFDMRGFWADERREGGSWSASNPLFSAIYRYFKRREREFWAEADHIVSLTDRAAQVLEAARSKGDRVASVTVIPCCVDFAVFPPVDAEGRHRARAELEIAQDQRVLGYIGSLGGNYMLGEMLDFFGAFRRRHGAATFLFVTQVPETTIREAADARGLADETILVRPASRGEVGALMAAADTGIAFKQPSFSARACSPTKLGEMLALEIPVVANGGVGDVAEVIRDTGAGVIVEGFDQRSYEQAIDRLDALKPDMDRWRTATRRWFDLGMGVERYDAIYRSLMNAPVGSNGGIG
jgi:glycosyltransferase involved in cell wall biosynthesis